jgi:ABC-type amino acid transport substrate-binding protein
MAEPMEHHPKRPQTWRTLGFGFVVLVASFVFVSAPAGSQPEEGLRVAVKEAPPFAWRDVNGQWAGLAVDLWRRIVEQAGLPPSRFEAYDLDGLLNAVTANRVDVGLGALSVTAEREARLDFTHPFFSSGLGVAVDPEGASEGLGSRLRGLLSRGAGWLVGALLLSLLVVGLLFTWVERRRNPTFRDTGRRQAAGTGFWWALIMALGHKGIFPQTVLGRVLAALMMVASLLLLSVFVGAIASVLTVSQLEDRITGPKDLRRFRVATITGTTSEAFLVRERVTYRRFESVERALEALLDGNVDAVVYDRPLLRYYARGAYLDRIRVLSAVFDPQDYAFALAPGSPYREAVNRALLDIRGSRWWRDQVFQHLGE